jgi:hypothetical protein
MASLVKDANYDDARFFRKEEERVWELSQQHTT